MPKVPDIGYRKSDIRLKLSDFRHPTSDVRTGYTLIEFVVVLGLLALVVGSALLFLTSILRGTNQANISAEVKQNGQAALDSLERQIRGGKSAVGLAPIPAGASNGVAITNSDGSPLYIACFTPTSSNNGWIGVSILAPSDTVNNYKTLTNTDPVSGINVSSCSLSAASGSTLSADVVTIKFTADKAIKAPQRSDFNASAVFQTTVSLRKY